MPMIATLPAIPTSATHQPGQRRSAGASSDWNRPQPRKKAPYAHQNSQWELTNAKWIHPATSDSAADSSTAADHRAPRVRWPATTRSGLIASSDTAQDRPRLDTVRFRVVRFFFTAGLRFLAVTFGLCLVVGFLCLTFTLTLRLTFLAFFLTLLPRTLTFGWGAAGTFAGTEMVGPEPPEPREPLPPPPWCSSNLGPIPPWSLQRSASIGSSPPSPTSNWTIMSWSSCTRLWQCIMYLPFWCSNRMMTSTFSDSPT